MPVNSEKQDALKKRMERLQIYEDDLVEKFIAGSGPGGQKINKTASCVYLKHLPSGLEVKCQKERSRELNRYRARVLICDKVAEILFQEKTKKVQEREKKRRQKQRRSRRTKQKMIEQKKRRSAIKTHREHPSIDD